MLQNKFIIRNSLPTTADMVDITGLVNTTVRLNPGKFVYIEAFQGTGKYLRLDGSSTMTGNLKLGDNNITGVNGLYTKNITSLAGTFPSTYGSVNQVLTTDGSGNLLWTTPGGGGVIGYTGNIITVDAVYGNDTNGASNPHYFPFLTINAALSYAVSGDTVFIRPGNYNEIITVPSGISLRGSSTQTTIIQRLNVTSNTTLLTLSNNCRVEDLTFRLTSVTSGLTLTGVNVPSGASVTSKLRTLVVNVSYTGGGDTNVYGVVSAGTSTNPTIFTSSNLIRATTINSTSDGNGIIRSLLISGDNRVAVRDTVFYATGTINAIGIETTNINAVADIKTSSIYGSTNDIRRTLGTIIIGESDLVNNNAGIYSFTPSQAPATLQYGVINGFGNNRRYYLLPGTIASNQLVSEQNILPYTASFAFPFVFLYDSIVISFDITYTQTLTAGEVITVNIHKNKNATPSLSLSLLAGETSKTLTTSSITFHQGDTLDCTLVTTGTPSGNGNFNLVIGYY